MNMARNKKRQDGLYATQFRYNGKRYTVYSKNRKGLDVAKAKKIEELEKAEQNYINPTVNAYYEYFTDIRRREVKESTLRAQRSQFNNIASVLMPNGTTFGEMHLKDITRRDIETARTILLNNGKSPENLNIMFAHLNHIFNTAVIDDTIVKNPCKALKQLKRESTPIGENRHRALTVEETQKFFEGAKLRNSYYLNDFLIMIKTGMRIGEISALYPTDIDKANGFIHVRRTVTRDEVGGYQIGSSTKTYSGIRDIPLTDEVAGIIKQQHLLNCSLFSLDKNGLLFKSTDGGILKEYSINREIKRICQSIDIEYFTCHAFRNTFATRFIEQRPQDYKILSEIMGHKDISITLNLYTHVMRENKIIAMNEIDIKTS